MVVSYFAIHLYVLNKQFQLDRWWGGFPMLGFSADKIVVSMQYYAINNVGLALKSMSNVKKMLLV